jgi:hypothetical protein
MLYEVRADFIPPKPALPMTKCFSASAITRSRIASDFIPITVAAHHSSFPLLLSPTSDFQWRLPDAVLFNLARHPVPVNPIISGKSREQKEEESSQASGGLSRESEEGRIA